MKITFLGTSHGIPEKGRRCSSTLIFDDGNIKVTAFLNGHIAKSYSFIAEIEAKTIFFSGDLKSDDGAISDYQRITKNYALDLCACEASHFSGYSYKEAILENKPKIFCFNHYQNSKINDLEKLKKELKDICEINILKDNISLEI